MDKESYFLNNFVIILIMARKKKKDKIKVRKPVLQKPNQVIKSKKDKEKKKRPGSRDLLEENKD